MYAVATWKQSNTSTQTDPSLSQTPSTLAPRVDQQRDGDMCGAILWDDTSLWRWAVQSQAFSCDGDTDRRQSHRFTGSRRRYLGVTRGLSLTCQHCFPWAYFPWTTEVNCTDSETGDEVRWDIYLRKGANWRKSLQQNVEGALQCQQCFLSSPVFTFLTLTIVPYGFSHGVSDALSYWLFLASSRSWDRQPTKARLGKEKPREKRRTKKVIPGCRHPFASEWSVD